MGWAANLNEREGDHARAEYSKRHLHRNRIGKANVAIGDENYALVAILSHLIQSQQPKTNDVDQRIVSCFDSILFRLVLVGEHALNLLLHERNERMQSIIEERIEGVDILRAKFVSMNDHLGNGQIIST